MIFRSIVKSASRLAAGAAVAAGVGGGAMALLAKGAEGAAPQPQAAPWAEETSPAANPNAKPNVPADPKYLDGWRMAGANPERTSWVPEEVRGQLKPLWFKPVEPYIQQKVQLVPELAEYLRAHAAEKVRAAMAEHEGLAPYWFVAKLEEGVYEGATQHLLVAAAAIHLRYADAAGAGASAGKFAVNHL